MSVNNRSSIVSFALKTLVGAVASAVLISANAAGLGKLTVMSALGQPLRAEIELTAVTPEEASGLAVRLAPPEAFRTANIDFNPALSALRFEIDQRDGRRVIRVSSSQPLNEPFVDLLLELNWNGGRMVREYTFLLDPPDVRTAQSPQVAAPVDLGPARTPTSTTTATTAATAAPASAADGGRTPAAAVKPAAKAVAEEVTVKRGDTLTGIANQVKPVDVSLDVMLVALYRANPEAFSGNNMNRLKSGQILAVPNAEAIRAAGADTGAETSARGVVVAHARDFNAYRARLASQVANSTPGKEGATGQNSSGKITAKVEEKPNAVNAARDKLTLSRAAADKPGGGKTGAAVEDKIARQKQVDDASSRVKELEKNVTDLEKLMAVKSTSTATAPVAPVAAGAAASAPAPVPTPMAPVIPPRKLEEPGMFEKLMANSQMVGLLIAALLVAIVAVLAAIAARRRRKFVVPRDASGPDGLDAAPAWDPVPAAPAAAGLAAVAAADTRTDAVEPVVGADDSVFRTDFSPADFAPLASQLDNNDVDPVAEADVYIAYGRDAQAEEILKEALRNHPERHAVRLKLLEIYATRQDARTFESQASELYSLTRGQGDEWAQAARMGRELDAGNPLYAHAEVAENADAAGSADGFGAAPVAATAGVVAAATAAAAYAAYDHDADADAGADAADVDAGAGAGAGAGGHADAEFHTGAGTDGAALGAAAADAVPADYNAGFDADLETALPQAADATVSPTANPADFDFGDLDLAAADPTTKDPLAPPAAPFLQDDSFNLSYDTPSASAPILSKEPAYDPSMDFSLDLPAEPASADPVVETTADAKAEAKAQAKADAEAQASADATRVPSDFDAADFTIPDVPALAVPPAEPAARSAVELAAEPVPEPAANPVEPNPQGAPEFDLSGIDFDLDSESEPTAADTARADIARADNTGVDIARTDTTRAESDRADNDRSDNGRIDNGRIDNGRIDNDLAENDRGASDRAEPMSALHMEMDTKLDLAVAYQEIGDKEGARELLDEVLRGGSDEQVAKANAMKTQLG